MVQHPKKPTGGLRHVALFIKNFEACKHFYVDLLGMHVVWQPDEDNLYLTSGNDNLALHRAKPGFVREAHQVLDHLGFIIDEPNEVDVWHAYLSAEDVVIKMAPKTHRDGARSFYCEDPDGNHVQVIYIPGVSAVRV